MASRPVSEIASNAASARSGAVRTATGPASACTIIRLTACERMSCISRAIRARSRAAACSVSMRCVSSSCRARSSTARRYALRVTVNRPKA